MAPSTLRKAIDAVKDQTSIGLAMVSNSTTASDLEVAIVKATRHDEYPAEERHIREILSLTCYSRGYINSCVTTVAKRLNKTRNWIVALKTLMLVHRLLSDGDAAYEQEIFYATRRGTRLLNMADFRDWSSRSGAWDFSAFVRAYALYLDERLEFRMQARRGRRKRGEGDGPARERIFLRARHLLNLLDCFLACRPAGEAKHNRIVLVALYTVVKESFQIYFDIAEVMGMLVDRFMELEVPYCVKVYEIFARIGKQFDELEMFYIWCKSVGVARSSDYPEVEKITSKKLEIMDEFIRDKSILAQTKRTKDHQIPRSAEPIDQEDKEPDVVAEDLNAIKALPPPEGFINDTEENTTDDDKVQSIHSQEDDLLDLREEDTSTHEDQGDKLALALFDGTGSTPTTSTSAWEAFTADDSADWETTLVQSASHLSNQKVTLGGGFNMSLLDGMYQQPVNSTTMKQNWVTGSASSDALGSVGRPMMLALPAPPVSGWGAALAGSGDPFQASLLVPAPPYVQMSEMQKKQKLFVEEQLLWQQYASNERQDHLGMAQLQPNSYSRGSYTFSY